MRHRIPVSVLTLCLLLTIISSFNLGLIGAPSFVVDGEVFWGGDRLAQALDWACGVRPVASVE